MTEGDALPVPVRCPVCWAPAYRTGAWSVLLETPGGLVAVGASHVRYTCRICGAVTFAKATRTGRLFLRRPLRPERRRSSPQELA